MDLEAIPVASDLGEIMTGVCFAMQPENMPAGFRNKGSIRDFAAPPRLAAGGPAGIARLARLARFARVRRRLAARPSRRRRCSPSTASANAPTGATTSRVTPRSSHRRTSSRSLTGPPTQIWNGRSGSRSTVPCSSRSSRSRSICAAADSKVWPIPIQPSASRRGPAQRRLALAADEDRRPRPLHRLRLERDGVEREELAVVLDLGLGPESLADRERLVDAAAAGGEVEPGRDPLLLEPARADAELDPAAAHDVERLHGAGRDERVAQADVVDVRAEADVRAAGGEEREVGERVEDRRGRRDRRVVLARRAATGSSATGKTRCSGSQTDS